MRIAVIGANGQIGSEIVAQARAAGIEVLPFTHAQCDVTDAAAVGAALAGLQKDDVVVNTAAYHRVDDCQSNAKQAFAVNACGAFHVAAAANLLGAAVVYFSSDYVFDGAKRRPYVESDEPRPLSVYGVSKLAGEMLVSKANAAHYIIRVAGVFGLAGSGGKGGNFVETMIANAKAGESLRVVDDLVMSPTYAVDAAKLLVALLQRQAPYGAYHLTNAGQCSWYEFARCILELSGLNAPIEAVKMSAWATPAPRPAYSVLGSERLQAIGLRPASWQQGLKRYLASRPVALLAQPQKAQAGIAAGKLRR